jgi:hypothetical protein
MDDADGGRRGLRARPGAGLLQAPRDHWGLGWFAEGVDLGGSSSLNLLVGDTDRRFVVRVHRPHVTPERLGAIHQARHVLLAGGMPCAPLVRTLQGAPWIGLQGRHVEVGEAGRRPQFANHLEPADVASSVRRGTARIRGWRPTAAERSLAAAPRSSPS